MILLYVTNPNAEAANSLARHLLEKKLIACANMFPVHSMYLDNGIKEDNECILIAKTTVSFDKVKKEIEKLHLYTTPCILKISAKANKKYNNWMKNMLK